MPWWNLPYPLDWILSIVAVVVFHGGLIFLMGSSAYSKIMYGLLLLFILIIPVASLSLFTLFLLPFAPIVSLFLAISFLTFGGYGVYWSYRRVV